MARPGAYRTFWIQDAKPQLISAAPFRDGVVHYALVRVIEPLFERRFIDHSCPYRRGKGTRRARAQFVRLTVEDSDVHWLCDRISTVRTPRPTTKSPLKSMHHTALGASA